MGWRDVPVGPKAVGPLARSVMPRIRQFFVANKVGNEKAFERKLYVIRRRFESTAEDRCYVFTGSADCELDSSPDRARTCVLVDKNGMPSHGQAYTAGSTQAPGTRVA